MIVLKHLKIYRFKKTNIKSDSRNKKSYFTNVHKHFSHLKVLCVGFSTDKLVLQTMSNFNAELFNIQFVPAHKTEK